ncbi:unnamed protein product, partial [Closterium sp. Naga37s-1]
NGDVKMPCHLVLAKLAEKYAPSVLVVVDALVEPLENIVTIRVKADSFPISSLSSPCLPLLSPSSTADNYDVKMPCHLVLAKLAEKCAPSVLAVVDAIVEPLEKTVTTRVKADAVKQEVDRNEDMIRSALRAGHALSRIRGDVLA